MSDNSKKRREKGEMVNANCAWCKKGISVKPSQLKEKNYCCLQHLGFDNAIRQGANIEQIQEELQEIVWTEPISYLTGLITTDGTLRKGRKQIKFSSSSKNLIEQVTNIIFNITGRKQGYSTLEAKLQNKRYIHYQIQFTSHPFYDFCRSIGLTPDKTYSLGKLSIPKEYFPSFLRGVIDGDGNYNLQNQTRNKRVTIRIYSGSKQFLEWLNESCVEYFGISEGSIIPAKNELGSKYILTFRKIYDVLRIFKKIYENHTVCYVEKKEPILYFLVNMDRLLKKYNPSINNLAHSHPHLLKEWHPINEKKHMKLHMGLKKKLGGFVPLVICIILQLKTEQEKINPQVVLNVILKSKKYR